MLTLQRILDKIRQMRGRADDLEADRQYEQAGVLRDAADEMQAEIESAIGESVLCAPTWDHQPRARAS